MRPGDCFVDVGANIGYFTLLASRAVGPSGRVLAFEPDPDNYRLLALNCKHNGCDNVTLFREALSDSDSSGRLYLSDSNRGDHTIYPTEGERQSQVIHLARGDTLLKSQDARPRLIKIDTQGSEYQVLLGLENMLAEQLEDLAVLLEFSPNSVRHTSAEPLAVLDLLESLQAHCYVLDNFENKITPIPLEQLRQ